MGHEHTARCPGAARRLHLALRAAVLSVKLQSTRHFMFALAHAAHWQAACSACGPFHFASRSMSGCSTARMGESPRHIHASHTGIRDAGAR